MLRGEQTQLTAAFYGLNNGSLESGDDDCGKIKGVFTPKKSEPRVAFGYN